MTVEHVVVRTDAAPVEDVVAGEDRA